MTPETPQHAARRQRIECQGYVGLDDETLAGLDPWLRLTPFMNGLLIALGAATGVWGTLVVVAALHALAVLLPRHPVEELYNGLIRPLEGGGAPAIPASPRRKRLVHALLALMLSAAAFFFAAGWALAGTSLAWLLAANSGWQAAHQICLLCAGLRRIFGPPSSS